MSAQPPPPGQPEYGSQPPAYQPPPSYPQPNEAPQPGYAPPPQPGYAPPAPQPGYAPPAQQGYAPPQQGYPAPPAQSAPGGFNQPSYGGSPAPKMSFNLAAVDKMDWAIFGVAFLAFIFSFFPYYTVSVSGGGFSNSASESAWNGFFGWFAVLLVLIGAGLIAVELFVPQLNLKLPIPVRLASLIAWAIATLSVILALFVFPEDVPSGLGIDTGRGFGYWADLVLIIAGVVLSVLRLKATGGKLPWEKGPSGHSASTSHGYPPASAPPAYQPPPSYQQPPAAQQPSYQPPPAPGYQQPGYQPPAGPPQGGQPPNYPPPPQQGGYPQQ
jgi:hypothetical protein